MSDFSIPTENAIQEHLLEYFDKDMTCIRDCANAGHGSGSCGMIYYNESTRFYRDYSDAIWESLENYSSEMGEDTAEFVGTLISEHDVRDHKMFAATLVATVLQYEASNITRNVEYYRERHPEMFVDTTEEDEEE